MPDFNVRSDSVNVEQIMEQIRARIREKRGVDYTEQQIRELAAVKLEKFLDPRGVRSDLLDQFRMYYQGKLKTTLAELRRSYELLVLKVIALLQDADPPLAKSIATSREAIWGILSDPVKFSAV